MKNCLHRFAAWLTLSGALLCSGLGAAEQPVLRVITEKENHSTVELKIGEGIMIELPANATTGYSWTYFLPAETPLRLKFRGYVVRDPKLIGSPGEDQAVYHATKKGSATLLAFYHRPWEKLDPKKDRCFILHVEVKGK